VKTVPLLGFVLGCLLLSGCAGSRTNVITPPPGSTASDSIRVGDKITVRLSGVPPGEDYINEIQIPESGEFSLPELTQNFHAAGMLPGALANQIATAYRDSKIFTNPNVTVIPEERFVNIGGDVRSPTRVLYTPDLTLLGAINSCGGFDEYANKHNIRILRGSQVYYVDATRALSTPGQDPPVYPGDEIFVPRSPL
jgi:protein involved in polysaccharide export with SLBB domain